MSLYRSSKAPATPAGITEFEILRARHKFLREDGGDEKEGTAGAGSSTWDDQLAKKYYDSLYREFAICDLKHFKSGNFSLRWRTEDEVLSGTGETTCANSRCEFHNGSSQYREDDAPPPPLTTLELPFGYEEHGEAKSALVKVVLCPGCVRKLMWKRTKEKEREQRARIESEGREEGGLDMKNMEKERMKKDGGRRRDRENDRRGKSTALEEDVAGSAAEESQHSRKKRERNRDDKDRGRRERRRVQHEAGPRGRTREITQKPDHHHGSSTLHRYPT